MQSKKLLVFMIMNSFLTLSCLLYGEDDADKLIREGHYLMYRNEHKQGIAAFKKALKLRPGDANLMESIASAYVMMGEYDKAMEIWEEELRLKPLPPALGFDLKESLMFAGQREKALEVYLKVAELDPDNAFKRCDVGRIYYELKNYKESVRELERCRSVAKKNGMYLNDVHYWLGLNFHAMGKMKKALKEFQIHITDRETDIMAGERWIDWEWVSKNTNILNTLKPKTFQEYFGLGVVFCKIGEGEKALKLWHQAEKIHASKKLYFELGQYNENGCPGWNSHVERKPPSLDKAVEFYRKAFKDGYYESFTWFNLAVAYEKIGNIERSNDFYIESIFRGNDIEAEDAENHLTVKDTYAGQNRKPPSRELIKRIKEAKLKRPKEEVKKIPKLANNQEILQANKDIIAERKKLSKERIAKFENDEKKNMETLREPFYVVHQDALFSLLVLGIAAVLVSIVQTKPYYHYYLLMGNRHLTAKQYDKANKYYEHLFHIRNGKYLPFAKLKEIYLKTGRRDEKAIHVFEKIYKENPEDKEVITALANAYAEKTA